MNSNYTLLDFFAGIGGIRLGFEQTKRVQTVFSCEKDKDARRIYEANFKPVSTNDINELRISDIPRADILSAGLPCQSFSLLGKKRGLNDANGMLFFRLAEIIEHVQPKALFIENVKNMFYHDKGRSFRKIIHTLSHTLGYHCHYHVYNSAEWNIPQNRRRIYIVAFKEDIPFLFPSSYEHRRKHPATVTVRPYLEKQAPRRCYLGEKTWRALEKDIGKKTRSGFAGRILPPNGIAEALSTNLGPRNLVRGRKLKKTYVLGERAHRNSAGIRWLTTNERAHLMDFPPGFILPETMTSAARLLGNSVTVGVVRMIAWEMVKALDKHSAQNRAQHSTT